MKRIFYKAVYKVANRWFPNVAQWAYMRWLGWYLKRDTVLGYWRFSEDFMGVKFNESDFRFGDFVFTRGVQ